MDYLPISPAENKGGIEKGRDNDWDGKISVLLCLRGALNPGILLLFFFCSFLFKFNFLTLVSVLSLTSPWLLKKPRSASLMGGEITGVESNETPASWLPPYPLLSVSFCFHFPSHSSPASLHHTQSVTVSVSPTPCEAGCNSLAGWDTGGCQPCWGWKKRKKKEKGDEIKTMGDSPCPRSLFLPTQFSVSALLPYFEVSSLEKADSPAELPSGLQDWGERRRRATSACK